MVVLILHEMLDGRRGAVGGEGAADEEDVQRWASLDGMLPKVVN